MSALFLIKLHNRIGKLGVFLFLFFKLFIVFFKNQKFKSGWKETKLFYNPKTKALFEKHRILSMKNYKNNKNNPNFKELENKQNTVYPMS